MEVKGIEGMYVEAARFVEALSPSGRHATVVALSGDLGAGKTTFVKGIAAYYGIEETVTSPTFVIEKVYKPQAGPFGRIVHIDAYRLEDVRELEVLGFNEMLKDPMDLILIEWPERVEGIVPKHAHRLSFMFIDEDTREIAYLAQ